MYNYGDTRLSAIINGWVEHRVYTIGCNNPCHDRLVGCLTKALELHRNTFKPGVARTAISLYTVKYSTLAYDAIGG
jgi:hypothetical protein